MSQVIIKIENHSDIDEAESLFKDKGIFNSSFSEGKLLVTVEQTKVNEVTRELKESNIRFTILNQCNG